MSEYLVETRQLTKSYGDVIALKNVSLTLSQGEVLGLLGPNGAGKSTTIKLITGMMGASQGQVLLNGIDLAEKPLLAKQQLGYLAEHPPVYPELTVDEYLLFCARLRQVPKAEQALRIEEVKQRCQLGDMNRRLIKHLSKGYQQRVGIAQAILHRPKLVVLDEPTSGLDPNQIRDMLVLIKDLAKDQAVLLSTHILSEVEAVCDRVLILHQGEQVYADSLDALLGQDLRYHLCFKSPPELSELASLPEVLEVQAITNGFDVVLEPHAQISDLAAQWVDYGLLELTPIHHSLEQIFSRLTQGQS